MSFANSPICAFILRPPILDIHKNAANIVPVNKTSKPANAKACTNILGIIINNAPIINAPVQIAMSFVNSSICDFIFLPPIKDIPKNVDNSDATKTASNIVNDNICAVILGIIINDAPASIQKVQATIISVNLDNASTPPLAPSLFTSPPTKVIAPKTASVNTVNIPKNARIPIQCFITIPPIIDAKIINNDIDTITVFIDSIEVLVSLFETNFWIELSAPSNAVNIVFNVAESNKLPTNAGIERAPVRTTYLKIVAKSFINSA